MNPYQEPKYQIGFVGESTYEDCIGNQVPKLANARIINRQTGKPIPDDEPILILRAQDCYAAAVLSDYANRLPAGMHKEAVSCRAIQFMNWAEDHPKRMHEPTTQIDEHWTTAGNVILPGK